MKKAREYYVCDICGAEAPEQIVYRGCDQTDAYGTRPVGWTRGFNVHVDICQRCTEKLDVENRLKQNEKRIEDLKIPLSTSRR